MKNILLFCTLLISGCSSLVETQKFPEANTELLKKCEDLTLINKDQVTLSELSKTVVKNYQKYHNCANLVEAWHEWYDKQKSIYEEASK